MLAGDPWQGGATWAVRQYVLELERLGHDVWLVEPVAELRPDVVSYFGDVSRAFGLEGRASLVSPADEAGAAPDVADLLVNIAADLTEVASCADLLVTSAVT